MIRKVVTGCNKGVANGFLLLPAYSPLQRFSKCVLFSLPAKNTTQAPAVIAESFERIHRSNLMGMGVLPLKFMDGQNAEGTELER